MPVGWEAAHIDVGLHLLVDLSDGGFEGIDLPEM